MPFASFFCRCCKLHVIVVLPAYQLFCTFNGAWSLLLLKRRFFGFTHAEFASHIKRYMCRSHFFGKCNCHNVTKGNMHKHFVVRSGSVLCWWRHRTLIIKILNFIELKHASVNVHLVIFVWAIFWIKSINLRLNEKKTTKFVYSVDCLHCFGLLWGFYWFCKRVFDVFFMRVPQRKCCKHDELSLSRAHTKGNLSILKCELFCAYFELNYCDVIFS